MEHTRGSGLILDTRASSFDIPPNGNDPATVPPATVGPPEARPGDPDGVMLLDVPSTARANVPPRPTAWSGWPAEWCTPNWFSRFRDLTDTAWGCLDLNSSLLATMPPYLVNAAPSLNADWLNNPDPDLYTSWEEFAEQLFWDYQMGEAFVLVTTRYNTGWPARFHVVEPWMVNVEMTGRRRRYSIGGAAIDPDDILHVRYKSRIGDAHGHGPLEVASLRLVAAEILARYATNIAAGIPSSVLVAPGNLSAEQAANLQSQWVEARISALGLPAVLSGGLDFKTLTMSPTDLGFVDLARFNESRIAVLLGVPPFLMGLPSGGDSMTYSNVTSLFDYHWRAGLRPKAAKVMAALSYWALPRGTTVELNRDEYVKPGPLERAQTWQILVELGVLSVEQVQEMERYTNSAPTETLSAGVLQ